MTTGLFDLSLFWQVRLVWFAVGFALGWSAAMGLALWALHRRRRGVDR